jgi:hypothetical protein
MLQDESIGNSTQSLETSPSGPIPPSSEPPTSSAPPISKTQARLPQLSVRILATDVTKHLDGVHRQKGGIGSQGFDEKQKNLRAFFGGGAVNEK